MILRMFNIYFLNIRNLTKILQIILIYVRKFIKKFGIDSLKQLKVRILVCNEYTCDFMENV